MRITLCRPPSLVPILGAMDGSRSANGVRHRCPRLTFGLTAGLAATSLFVLGCGEDGHNGQHSSIPKGRPGYGRQARNEGEGMPPSGRARQRAPHHQRFTPGHSVRQGDVVFKTPPRPTAYQLPPTRGCNLRLVGGKSVTRPPTPGLRARRTLSRSVVVTYTFDALPASCQPVTLYVGVDVNRDIAGAFTTQAPVKGTTGEVTVRLPAGWRKADVATLGARARDGALSNFAAVLIR